MGDKLIQGKTLMLRDAIYIVSLLISCAITYTMTANTTISLNTGVAGSIAINGVGSDVLSTEAPV